MAKKKKDNNYFAASRRLAASFVFVAPLFAVYQAGIFFDPSARNGTDPIYRELLHRFHQLGFVFINLVLLGLLCLAIARTRTRRVDYAGLYWLMLGESCAWTGAMLLAANYFPFHALSLTPILRDLTAGIGAGVYEETLFRFLLMGGLILLLHRGLGGSRAWVVPVAIAAAAALFSLAHHEIGGEPWDRSVFLFRTGMGVILGCIYWFRGLGICVYTHALYNVALVAMTP